MNNSITQPKEVAELGFKPRTTRLQVPCSGELEAEEGGGPKKVLGVEWLYGDWKDVGRNQRPQVLLAGEPAQTAMKKLGT